MLAVPQLMLVKGISQTPPSSPLMPQASQTRDYVPKSLAVLPSFRTVEMC